VRCFGAVAEEAPMSKHVLISLAVATALVTAGAASARADDASPGDGSSTTHEPNQENTQHHVKKKAHDGAKKVKAKKAHSSASQKAKKGTDALDESARAANAQVVGERTSRENEQKARNPELRPKEGEGKEGGQEVGKTTLTAAQIVGEAVADTTRATDKPGSYQPFAAEWNPIGLFVGGRVSLNLEWVPVTHHAIEVSPHFTHTTSDVATSPDVKESQSYTGFGGEIGYRYYTGHRGPNGVFVGPSIIAGAYNASLPGGDKAFTNLGIAADVGAQAILFDHLVVGGGVGIEYLKVSHDFGDLPTSASMIASSGVKPRLLLEAGAAF
jgi:hypothetical protein